MSTPSALPGARRPFSAGHVTASYAYYTPEGEFVGHKERHEWQENGALRKRFVWRSPGGTAGLGGRQPSLFRVEILKYLRPEVPVEIVEGEKCVLALQGLDFHAVCCPHGAGGGGDDGGWQDEWTPLFRGRTVRLWPDNDGAGRKHMEAISKALRPVVDELHLVEISGLPEHGDVADWIAAGHTRSELLRVVAGAVPLRRRWRFDASTLAARRFPALQWAVKDVLPEGLCILGGKPKMGKSWMALQIAIEIARGGTVFGSVPVERGNVLYLALEDTARRLRDRQEKLLGGDPPFDLRERLDLWLECPKLNDGGMEQLEEWLKGHPRARLVIVDTLKRIRPRAGGGSVYDEDYDALSPLADLAHRHHVCLLVVHHLRKAEAEDPIDALSGSTGLTGAPDGILVLRRVRGQADAELWVVHREGEETELALRFDSSTARWSLIGAAEEYRLSRERRSILDTLTEFGPQTPKDIAEALGRNRSSIRALLAKMHRAGEVTKDKDGRYLLPVAVLPGAAEGGNCQDPPVEAKSA